MELWRRIILVLCIAVGIGAAYLACLDPVVIVKPYEEKRAQKLSLPPDLHMPEGEGFDRSLLASVDRDATKAKRQPQVLKVEGQEWADFFRKAHLTLEGKGRGTPWADRFPSGSHPMKALFFHPDENPLNTLPPGFAKSGERLRLMRDNGGGPECLEVTFRSYSDNDFRLGSGFSSYPKPPGSFLYPYRYTGFIIILAGFGLYLFLPWPVMHPGALRYDRWRIVMSDLLGVIFFTFPIAVTILVVGGTLQALREGFLVFLLFSPFFVGGLAVLWVSAWYGSYEVLRAEEGLRITTFLGTRLFRYGDMRFFQPVTFAPPRWLVIVSWIAVLASAGAARLGAAGRAFMLSSSFTGSMGIGLRNGATLFIIVTDQMGTTALKGFEELVDVLRKRGVEERRDVKIVRSLGLETLRLEKPE